MWVPWKPVMCGAIQHSLNGHSSLFKMMCTSVSAIKENWCLCSTRFITVWCDVSNATTVLCVRSISEKPYVVKIYAFIFVTLLKLLFSLSVLITDYCWQTRSWMSTTIWILHTYCQSCSSSSTHRFEVLHGYLEEKLKGNTTKVLGSVWTTVN